MDTQGLLYLLFGVLFILIVFVDIHLYLHYRKISNKMETMVQEFKELKNIVDKLRKRI
jgi:hypothetical protein